jgi:hypothetical protein
MNHENGQLIDDARDPIGDVYDDEVSQGDLLDEGEEPEVYEDEEDLRRRSPHE